MDNIFEKIVNKLTCREKKLIIIGIASGMMIHFALYSQQLTNPDGRWFGGGYSYRSTYWEVALGRWLLYIVDCTRGFLTNYFITLTLSILSMSLAGIFLIRCLDIKSKVNSIILIIMMMAMPCFSYTLSYWYCADAYSYAMLLSIMSIYFTSKPGKRNFVYAAICIACMLGLYQSYLGVSVGLALINLILLLDKEEITIKEWFEKLGRYVLMVILGICLYWGILQIALKIWDTKLSSYSGAENVGIVNSITNLPARFLHTYHVLYEWMFGNEIIYNTYWKRQYLYGALLAVFGILFALTCLHKKMWKILLKGGGIILFPTAISIIEIAAPERDITILQSASMCLIIPFILKLTEIINKKEAVKIVVSVLSVLIVWSYILTDNATYLAVQTTQRQTETVLRNIYARMEEMEYYQVGDKVMFAGFINRINYPRDSKIYRMSDGLWSEMNSFWGTYSGSRADWFYLYYDLLGMKLNICSKEEYMAVINTDEFANMPLYPDKDSIQEIDGIICVKLMDNPPTEN